MEITPLICIQVKELKIFREPTSRPHSSHSFPQSSGEVRAILEPALLGRGGAWAARPDQARQTPARPPRPPPAPPATSAPPADELAPSRSK
ncbi:hypothetical protein EVAR_43139_1 [Eumeta japonica]|uniref:Uncharacterized protein n=1 Tax=Eumeta variegata TaxID=151549 RepID=A0A4C1XPU7_EUMVA|nr:hypothetical protein EVAR_43139_1 [Eumeta japonica]